MNHITRRQALKIAALAGGSILLPIGLQYRGYAQRVNPRIDRRVEPFSLPFQTPPILHPIRSDATTDYYQISVQKAQVEILPRRTTEIWGYNGITPGPTIKQHKDRQSVLRFINHLDVDLSLHLHGMPSLPQYDGYAEDLIPPEYYKDYVYPNTIAATFWYHDHALANTARNAYMGLAGMYIVQDDDELNMPLPKGDCDVPLVIQDKKFASDGSLIFDDQAQHSVMGDVITVNGVPWPTMQVRARKYRFRILNASVSRSYQLALDTGDDLIVIGTDLGLMPAPVRTKNMRIAMAERYDVIIDFSQYPVGTQIVLQNLGLPNNDNFGNTNKIMRFDVVRSEIDDSFIPNTLRDIEFLPESAAVRVRDFKYERANRMWLIDGKGWDANRVDANPELEEVEIWRLHNDSGLWFHPVHIHLIESQILDRNGQPPFSYERGLKDVFYVGERETVRIIGKFKPHMGKYMYHCHNMVHEDHDMMSQFEVGVGGTDPMSEPAKPL